MTSFLSREGNVPKISKTQEAWYSHIFGSNNEKAEYRSHRKDVQLVGTSPVEGSKSNGNKKFGDRIKGLLLSI